MRERGEVRRNAREGKIRLEFARSVTMSQTYLQPP